MFKKQILSAVLVCCLSLTLFLPATADTTDANPTETTEESVSTQRLFESQQFKETVSFLNTLNTKRIERGLAPLIITEELLTAAQTRAEELEISYQKDYRPDGTGWETIYTEQKFVNSLSSLEDGWECISTGFSDGLAVYSEYSGEYSSILNYNSLNMIGLGFTAGTVSTYDEEKDSTTEKNNPWVVHLLGRYTVTNLELATPLADTYPAVYDLEDLNLILKVTLLSPEGKEIVGYLPVINAMTTGHTANKVGTQAITITYKSPYYKNSTTKQEYKAYKKTLTFSLTTKKGTKPTTPSSFKATGTSYDKVTVVWSPSKNARSYDIYRSTKKKSGYKKIASVKTSNLRLSEEGLYTYIDTSVSNGIKYYYKLRGVNGIVNGSYTSVDEALPNIKAPSNVKCTSKTKTTIKIKWTKVAKATSYRVYYSTKKNGKYKRATSPSTTSCSYTIKKLKSKKTYYIKLLAYRSGRPSSYSKIIKVKTK